MKAREIDESITNEVLPIIGAGLAAGARLAAPAIARGVSNLLGRGGAQAAQTGARGAAQTAQRIEPKFDFSLPQASVSSRGSGAFTPPGTPPGTINVQPAVPRPLSTVPSNMPTVTGPAAPRAASTAQPAGRINMPSTQAPAGQAGPAAGGKPYTPIDPKSTVAPRPEIGTSIGRDAAISAPGGATLGQKAAGAATAAGIGAAGIGTIGTSNRGATPPAQGSTSEPPRPPLQGVEQPRAVPPTSFDPPGPDTDTSDRPGSFQDKLRAAQAQGWPDNDRLPPPDWAPMGTPVGRGTDGGQPAATTSAAPNSTQRQPAAVATPNRPQLPKGVQDIATLNKLDNPNLIKPGQVLQLPGGGSYTVKAGDNLSKIASQQRQPAGSTDTPISPSGVRSGPNSNIDQATRDKALASVPTGVDRATLDQWRQQDLERLQKDLDAQFKQQDQDNDVPPIKMEPATSDVPPGTPAAPIGDLDPTPITRTGATTDDPSGDYPLPKESLERILQLSGYKKYAGR